MSYAQFVEILAAGAALSLLLLLFKTSAFGLPKSEFSFFAVPLPFLLAIAIVAEPYLALVFGAQKTLQ